MQQKIDEKCGLGLNRSARRSFDLYRAMIFRMPLPGLAGFLIATLFFANGCSSIPTDRINSHPVLDVSPQVIQHQAAPTSSWPPVAPSMAPIQIGSPDIFPPQPPAPVLLPPPKVDPLPIKKAEIKTETLKKEQLEKEELQKELKKPKPAVYRESKATSRKNKPAINFLSRFEGINWGDAPKPDMNRIEENKEALESNFSAYTIENDDAPAFGLKPGMIIYYFKENRFHKVEMIWEPDETEYSILEKNVLSAFGEPIEAEVLGSRRWIDAQAHLTVQFSDANATQAPSPGHLMSLLIEQTE